MLTIDPHPLLDLRAFEASLPAPLGELSSPPELAALLRPDARAHMQADDAVRAAVRDLLRRGGYKPTGRGKPASEYLVRAASEGALSAINPIVDAGNAVSLHSGLPISIVDLDRARPPLRVAIAGEGARYVFNASGQEIDAEGLLCLIDAEGPCANAVKDAQRTKTQADTRRVLAIVWGASALGERAERTAAWLRSIVESVGGRVTEVASG